MSHYKLTYHDITGPVESIRYMFHYSDVNYLDVQIFIDDSSEGDSSEDSSSKVMSDKLILEIDGKEYDNFKSIGRYVAKECMLYGLDDDEALEIDATVDSIEDISYGLTESYVENMSLFWEEEIIKDDDEKHNQILDKEKLAIGLYKLEQQVKENGGYFVRGKLSWADTLYAAYIELLSWPEVEIIHKNYPELANLAKRVHTHPKIKSYLRNCTWWPETLYQTK